MIRMTCDSRLLASAGLGALLLGATPASAQETSDPAAAAAAAGKPVIGAYGFDTQGMDRTVLPGDDFYAYAKGAWAQDRKTVQPGKSVSGRLDHGGRRHIKQKK